MVAPSGEVLPAPDEQARQSAIRRQARLTKPAGALGRLEPLGEWAAAVQGRCPPEPFRQVRVVICAGDHGVARLGVSAYPPEVTRQMVANFLAGGAAVNALARVAGAQVRVFDLSVADDVEGVPEEVTRHKVRRSTNRIDVVDAMTLAEAQQSLDAGRAIADSEVDGGADLLIPGDMGIGNTTVAATLTALVLDEEPVAVVGRGTGIDDQGWMTKVTVIRDALRRVNREHVFPDPLTLLSAAGGPDVAALVGLLVQAAVRRTPVLLDGVVVCAAALLAERVLPGSKAWWVAGHRSTEPAQQAVLRHLELTPVLDLGMRLGEGSGALVALGVVQSAIAALQGMATFDEAGVSGPA